MLSFRKPAAETIAAYLTSQATLAFSYAAVGATAATPPAGFNVDHARIKLGYGEQVFAAAKTALENWQHFRLGWVEASPADTPIEKGRAVAMLARSFGMWWLNACEERFLIEWDRADNSVWYDMLAFSRPRHILAWLGYPWVRHLQSRFRRESAAAMCRATAVAGEK